MKPKYRKLKIFLKQEIHNDGFVQDEFEPILIREEEYDSNGNPIYNKIKTSDIDYEEMKCTYNEMGFLTLQENLNTQVGNKEIIKMEYDDLNNITTQRTFYADGGNDKIITRLNTEKKPVKIEYYEDESDSSLYKIEEFFYNNNNLIEKKEHDGNLKNVLTTQYKHDTNGNPIEVIRANGFGDKEITVNVYDTNNNLVKSTVIVHDSIINYEEYEYDHNNNVINEIVDGDYSTYKCKYEYDINGNCIKKQYSSPEQEYKTEMRYNIDGNIVEAQEIAVNRNGDETRTIYSYEYEY